MGDTKIVYNEKFGILTFKREICAALGEEFWNELVKDIELPDIDNECKCQCNNMHAFMSRLEEMADAEEVKKILYKVRHDLHPSQSAWAREAFLEIGDLDGFLQKHQKDELEHFIMLNREKKDFYGQEITDEVLAFIKQNPSMLAPVRKGNKLYCMSFPYNMKEYLDAEDDKMKRYHACHCPFAKESILSQAVVSPALCNCSLGHVMNFTEAFLDRELEGKVVRSVLNGDLTCEYEVTIPEDIMEQYVIQKEADIVISNYYRYYQAFARSGIVEFHEGSVSWIAPKDGKNGPSLAFRIHLDEENAQKQIEELTAGIREKKVPGLWHIMPDAVPQNVISLLEENGFQDLAGEDAKPEPTMLLYKNDFKPCSKKEGCIVCRRVQTREDFKTWIRVVNTALHGWDMIDAENYYVWVQSEDIRIYLGEIDGVPVSTAATIQNGDVASLEFVSTLEEYRRRGVALAVCEKALADLWESGVNAVTLGACEESPALYEKLGFHNVYYNVLMQYRGTA